MSIWGDVCTAGKDLENGVKSIATNAADAADALSQEAFQTEKSLSQVGTTLAGDLSQAGKEIEKGADVVGHQAELFGEGVVTGAILNPINAVGQIANNVFGTNFGQLKFSNQQEVDNSWAGKIGEVAGTIADFVVTDGAASSLMGVEATSMTAMAVTGAIQGGVFTPSDPTKTGGNFILDRLENAGIDAGTFAVMGGVAQPLAGIVGDSVGTSLAGRVVTQAVSNAVGGAAGGVVSAESTSLLKQGKLASLSTVADQAGYYAAFGAAMGAGSQVLGAGMSALRTSGGGGGEPGATDALRTSGGGGGESGATDAADIGNQPQSAGRTGDPSPEAYATDLTNTPSSTDSVIANAQAEGSASSFDPDLKQAFQTRLNKGELARQADGSYVYTRATTGYPGTDVSITYSHDGQIAGTRSWNGVDMQYTYSPDGSIRSISVTGGGQPARTIEPAFTGYVSFLDDGTPEPLSVASQPVTRMTVGSDGSLTRWNDSYQGERTGLDGVQADISPMGTESVSGDALPTVRSELQTTVNSVLDQNQAERFSFFMQNLEARAQAAGLSDKELANTYYQLNRLLTSDSAVMPDAARQTLAQQFMYEAAWPTTIDQGHYSTCNVTAAVEKPEFTTDPARAAQMVADIATTGRYVTANGTVLDMRLIGDALEPVGETKNTFNQPYQLGYQDIKIDGQRTFLDQIVQTTSVNAHWQTVASDQAHYDPATNIQELRKYRFDPLTGEPAAPSSSEFDMKFGLGKNVYSDNFTLGSFKYDLLPSGQEALLQRAGTGWQTIGNAPGLFNANIVDAAAKMLNRESPILTRFPSDGPGVHYIDSPTSLAEVVNYFQQKDPGPVAIQVGTNDPVIGNSGGRPGDHMINIQRVYQAPDGQWMAETTNQYGSSYNHLGNRALPISTLYRAMDPIPSDLPLLKQIWGHIHWPS